MNKHIDILKKGVDVWNQWRLDNPELKPYLSFVTLLTMELKGINFKDAHFRNTNFIKIDLTGADFRGATLKNTIFTNTVINNADLRGTDFRFSEFKNIKIKKTQLNNAHFFKISGLPDIIEKGLTNGFFSQARLIENIKNGFLNLQGVYLRNASLCNSNLQHVDFSESDLVWTNFSGSDLSCANFQNADLRKTTFNETNLCGTLFNNTDFRGSKITNSNLSCASLTNSNLSGSDLSFSNLEKVDLSKAILANTILKNGSFKYTNFNKANLGHSKLAEAIFVSSNSTIFFQTNFKEAIGIPTWLKMMIVKGNSSQKFYLNDPDRNEEKTHKQFFPDKIIIIYTQEDYQMAKKLFASLKQIPKLTCWLDQNSLLQTKEFDINMFKTKEKYYMLAIITQNSVNDKMLLHSVNMCRFLSDSLHVLILNIDNCSIHHTTLKNLNTINFSPKWSYGINSLLKTFKMENKISQDGLLIIDQFQTKLSIILEFHPGIMKIDDNPIEGLIGDKLRSINVQFANDMGLLIPPIIVKKNANLNFMEYRILINETEVLKYELILNHCLAMKSSETQNDINGIRTIEPSFELPAIWIPSSQKEKAELLGYMVINHTNVILTSISVVIRSHADQLIGKDEVNFLLDNLSKKQPETREELRRNQLTTSIIQKVLQNLVKENVSIKDLPLIIETLTYYAANTKDPFLLTEYVRQKLARSIVTPYLSKDGILPVITFTTNMEKTLENSIQHTEKGSFLSIEPSLKNKVIEEVRKKSEKVAKMGYPAIILCSPALRWHFRWIIQDIYPSLIIISQAELLNNMATKSLEKLRIDNE